MQRIYSNTSAEISKKKVSMSGFLSSKSCPQSVTILLLCLVKQMYRLKPSLATSTTDYPDWGINRPIGKGTEKVTGYDLTILMWLCMFSMNPPGASML